MTKLNNLIMKIYDKFFNPIIDPKRIDCPKGYVVHHKDGDKYNNRKNNLEVISRSELLKRNLVRHFK